MNNIFIYETKYFFFLVYYIKICFLWEVPEKWQEKEQEKEKEGVQEK
jgi:hypothetical protein